MGDKSEDVFQIALADVKTELMCPVCKGYLEDTYTTACMHRFCKECIHRVLRLDTMRCDVSLYLSTNQAKG
jgi:hypothetical protein